MSISSLRGQITACGLYCPLTDLLSSAFGHDAPAVMLMKISISFSDPRHQTKGPHGLEITNVISV